MIAILLLALVLTVAAGIGATILQWMRLDISDTKERLVYSIPLGLGVIAHLVLVFGLIGWLTAGAVSCGLVILAIASIPGFKSIVRIHNPANKAENDTDPTFQTALRKESTFEAVSEDEGFLE